MASENSQTKNADIVRRAHYVLSSHWDREWYQTFQDFRYRLVHLMDQIIQGFKRGNLQGPFQTDGQAIVIEDYLEVRGKQYDTVKELVRTGKLILGPWYVLPDEFLVSAESLVRNLRLGRRIAREFGAEPSNAGFLCDMFGHNSQMPQIFSQFGIRGGFVWRGVNTKRGLFLWRGADGSEIPCHVFGRRGYCSYADQVRNAFRHVGVGVDPEVRRKSLKDYLEQEGQRIPVGPLLLFDGGDHQEWDRSAYEVVAESLGRLEDNIELIHGSLDSHLADLLPVSNQIETVLEGELREPGMRCVTEASQDLISGVLSSRIWIKQANAACEALLCHWAEPVGAMAHAALGVEYPEAYLDIAWRWLLKNQPHDSICGCSIDQVHEDMKFRFSQCRQIGERLTYESTRRIAAHIAGELNDNQMRVTVFNPLPYETNEVVDLTLHIPSEWPKFHEFFGYEKKPAFHLYDSNGNELPYQRIGQEKAKGESVIANTVFPYEWHIKPVRVAIQLKLPGLGYTTLTVESAKKTLDDGTAAYPTRHPDRPGLATSDRSMANEHIEVHVEQNGSISLKDKRTGEMYRRLLTFEDIADIGDGWNHGQAINDFAATSVGSNADVELLTNTPVLATLRIRTKMSLPAEFDFDTMTRSVENRRTLVIENYITIRNGSDRIEVSTHVHNNIKDHRLRVLLPSSACCNTFLADSAYDVIERPIALRGDNYRYRELEVETKPQHSWSAVYGGGRGLAVIASGLKETAVIDNPDRALALTLYRCTRRTVMTSGEPDGQLLMPMHFHYWIVPLSQVPDPVHLARLGQAISAGLRYTQIRDSDLAEASERLLATESSLLKVCGPVILSAFEMAKGAYELRAFNPTNTKANASFEWSERLAKSVRDVFPVNLEHQQTGPVIKTTEQGFSVAFEPKQVRTIRLTL